MNASIKTLISCGILLIVGSAHAHHSIPARFDMSQTTEFQGVLVDSRLAAPHSTFVIDVEQEDGSVERWEIEASPFSTLRRGGIDRDTFKPGDAITVVAHPPRNPEHREAYGQAYITSDSRTLGPSPNFARATPETVSANSLENLTGRWYLKPGAVNFIPAEGRGMGLPRPSFTPAGQEAVENYDPALSPGQTCELAPIPFLYFPGYLHDIQFYSDVVIIHHQVYDVKRTVPLHSEPKRAEPTGVFGITAGRIEGNTLVIENNDFPPSGWGNAMAALHGVDAPSSAQKTVTERFSVNEDGTILSLDFTLEDPVYLAEPYTGHLDFERIADDEPMYRFQCTPEGASFKFD